jgi:FkbM family methyltransferase
LNRSRYFLATKLYDEGRQIEQAFAIKQNETSMRDENYFNPTLAELNQSLGFNKLCRGRDGLFLVNENDVYIGRSLLTYGEYSGQESKLLNELLGPGHVVLEIGANIGSLTVGIARRIGPAGMVLAYEPQPVVFQNLCANIALNSLTNVMCFQAAIGDRVGLARLPFIRFDRSNNFGGTVLRNANEPGFDVSMITIDETFNYSRLDLMKIDVEGMELQVLEGARNVIQTFRPKLIVENSEIAKSQMLIRTIKNFGYRLWWHAPRLYDAQNFRGNSENVFADSFSLNMVCIHQSTPVNTHFREVTSETDYPLVNEKGSAGQ